MMRWSMIAVAGLAMLVQLPAGYASSHEGGMYGVSFAVPQEGASVNGEFRVKMAIEGMKVHKAGELMKGTGHHHLIIDGDCIAEGQPVPKDATHKHFGKGQTETRLKLAPGNHTLTLQFANGHHQSYGRDWCSTIHVSVK